MHNDILVELIIFLCLVFQYITEHSKRSHLSLQMIAIFSRQPEFAYLQRIIIRHYAHNEISQAM